MAATAKPSGSRDPGRKRTARKVSGAEAVHKALRRDIILLKLQPGAVLDELSLSKRFNLSRSPIREALIRLAMDGLIINAQNKSPTVKPLEFAYFPKFLDAYCLMSRMTARLAAMFRTNADIAAIEELHARHYDALVSHDVRTRVELNREFHAAISAAGKNPYFDGLYAKLLDEACRLSLARFVVITDKDGLPDGYFQGHLDLVNALKERDVEGIDRIAKHHAVTIWQDFIQEISVQPLLDADCTSMDISALVPNFPGKRP